MPPIKPCSAFLFLALSGCVTQPETYAPPMQRHAQTGPETGHLKHFIAMNDPFAEEHFLRDVRTLEAGYFRWTGQKPLFHFVLSSTRRLKYAMDFGVSSETLKKTGPFTMSIFVNGRELGKATYDSGGDKHFEKPVPAEWLVKGGDTVVSVEFDKVYVADDGVKLGVTLVRCGFKD